MSRSPEISICVPTYNGGLYLKECLDSIIKQTYEDFEVLIVDDCSKDDTVAIAKKYADSDMRVRLIGNEHNLGLVGNWNRAAELSRGKWVKFVFQDDVLTPHCLETMLRSTNADSSLVVCRRKFGFESGISQETHQYYHAIPSLDDVFAGLTKISPTSLSNAVLDNMGMNFIGESTAVLLNRSVFDDFGFFNPNLIMICDLEYWVRVGCCVGITYVPETLVTFRVHNSATSALNFNHRKYRVLLDQVIFAHDLAFATHYEPIRIAALGHKEPVDLAKMFFDKVREARWVANKANDEGDPELLKEWNQLAQMYPRSNIVNQNSSSLLGNIFRKIANRIK